MILTTIDQFIAAMPTAAEVEKFEDLKPYCNSAELWIKNNVLGKDLYAAIDIEDFADADLLQLCISVIANHAYWDAIPFLDLVHTNSGFGVISANNRVPASKERVERLREQCLIRRDNEVENLIDFLEQTDIYHDDWKGSPAYSILSDCLIQTAHELETFSEWTGTRKDFLKLRPKLIQETMLRIEPVLSSDYIAELIEKQRDGDLGADDLKVSLLIKQSLGCLLTGNHEAARKIAADALRYIDNNLASFTTYSNSSEYLARMSENYTNTADSQIFSSIYQ
ncbi:DUF6712 family protein [Mangrovibacterium sp.]|uniref:DUF6712 family protein n=1 Tax=Mangrovibacterium sp. TaxID=1961364 RepID=UPI003563003D